MTWLELSAFNVHHWFHAHDLPSNCAGSDSAERQFVSPSWPSRENILPELKTVLTKAVPRCRDIEGYVDPPSLATARQARMESRSMAKASSATTAAITPCLSLTLKRAEGVTETVLRRDITQVSRSGLSLMPQGLEIAITVERMADLLALLLLPSYPHSNEDLRRRSRLFLLGGLLNSRWLR